MVNEKSKQYAILRDVLTSNEKVYLELVESRLGGARMLAPAHAYATDQGVVVIRRYPGGVRRSIKIMKYNHITEIRVERGIIFCKIHFSLIGEQAEREENLKWIVGLWYKKALELVRFINKIHEKPVQGLNIT